MSVDISALSSLSLGEGSRNGTTMSKVPPDALCLILDLISTECIGKLWMCGDSGLCRSMRFGGVRKFRKEIKGGPYGNSVFHLRWPSLVTEFTQLVEFQMSCPTSCLRRPRPRFDLLPKGLRVLELGQGFVRRFLDSEVHQCPNLVALRLPETCALTRFQVENIPPNLLELQFALDANDCLVSLQRLACAATLNILHLHIEQRLPRVNISLAHMPILEKVQVFASAQQLLLPTTVTRLKVSGGIRVASPLPHGLLSMIDTSTLSSAVETLDTPLPRTLTKFVAALRDFDDKFISADDARELFPPTLTCLRLSQAGNVKFAPSMCRDMKHLKTLSIDFGLGEPSDAWSHRCKTLTDPFKNTSTERPVLPDSLTSYTATVSRNDDALPLVWPASLTHLVIGSFGVRERSNNAGSGENGSDDSERRADGTLKHWSETGTRINWPEKLASLRAIIVDMRVPQDYGVKGMRSLQELQREREERLDSVLLVPKTLTSLTVSSPYMHLPINAILPLQLRTLHLNLPNDNGPHSRVSWPAGWSALLPGTLTDLNINAPSSSHAIDNEWFENLKLPHLTRLEAPRCTDSDPLLLQLVPSPLLAYIRLSYEDPLHWKDMGLRRFEKLEDMHITTTRSEAYPKNFLDLLPPSVTSITFSGILMDNLSPDLIDSCRSKHVSIGFWYR